jgi:hypothetical protein
MVQAEGNTCIEWGAAEAFYRRELRSYALCIVLTLIGIDARMTQVSLLFHAWRHSLTLRLYYMRCVSPGISWRYLTRYMGTAICIFDNSNPISLFQGLVNVL